MKARTIHLTEDTVEILDSQYKTPRKRSQFIRNLVETALTQKKPEMKITVKLGFADTASNIFNELTIRTSAIGNLKEKIRPLLDAAEDLQNVITALDP